MAGRCNGVPYAPAPAAPTRKPAAEPSTALGKPSVSAAADDPFAQFDVVGLMIASATKQS
jgi:hypothetical protein